MCEGRPSDLAERGAVGQILAKGPRMMVGYPNRPGASAKALAHGWYHTGDAGGYLWTCDRMDDMINFGAESVYPREVERALIGHPGVPEVAAIGAHDECTRRGMRPDPHSPHRGPGRATRPLWCMAAVWSSSRL